MLNKDVLLSTQRLHDLVLVDFCESDSRTSTGVNRVFLLFKVFGRADEPGLFCYRNAVDGILYLLVEYKARVLHS